jgi:serine/threonine protein kinase
MSGLQLLPNPPNAQTSNPLLLPIVGKSSKARAGSKGEVHTPSLPGIAESPQSAACWTHVRRSDFKTIGYLGDGGFGQVRLVEYLGDGQKYALKSIEHALIREKCLSGSADSCSPMQERNIGIAARKWRSPFIVQLYATFQTPEKLHFVYELCPGGDLFELLSQQDGRHFNEHDSRFYSGEIALGLMHLHSHDVVHGDIKLENVLIGKDCHAKLTDLGSAIIAKPGCKAQPNLLATFSPPELLDGDGEYGKELDCWQLGYATLTMLIGVYLNLEQENMWCALQDMLTGVGASEQALHFCTALLESDRRKRLGFPDGAALLQKHPFFEALDWSALEQKLVDPPFMFEEFPLFGLGQFESSTPDGSPTRASGRRLRGFTWSFGPDDDDNPFRRQADYSSENFCSEVGSEDGDGILAS